MKRGHIKREQREEKVKRMKGILRWKIFEQKQRDQDKRNKIIFKKVLTTKKNSEMFF